MTPAQLTATSFASYSAGGRAFAAEHLSLLQSLPLSVCPSFLAQIQQFDTLFPAERELLEWQCRSLQALPHPQFVALVAPLDAIRLPDALRSMDWVQTPAGFITELTANLWSSGQINAFRDTTNHLFAAIPAHQDPSSRLIGVVLGKGATIDPKTVLRKLRGHGVMLTAVQQQTAIADLQMLFQPQPASARPYATWYVDGGSLHPQLATNATRGAVAVSYAELEPVRGRVLERMQATIASGTGGAEQMRTRMMETTSHDADARAVTIDPVLQRFYTELFTASSGPQIFSTSFVQWTGRELMRRARPQQVLLRYAARQRRRDMNEMFADQTTRNTPVPDPQGSLVDAEMGAYYTWLEANRITAPGKLTLVAWVEDQPFAVVIGANAPVGAVSATSMSLADAVKNFA